MTNPRRSRPAAVPRAASGAVADSPVALLAPGPASGEWELVRPSALAVTDAPPTRQSFPSLEAAAANLADAERFVLALPLSLGLVQRLALPPAESDELEDMARIQLEKILPYPVESVSLALTEISRTDAEAAVAVDTVSTERLAALCRPLTERGAWPLRVQFYARTLAAGAARGETVAFLSREDGRAVLGICEDGKLGFAQAVNGQTAEELAAELPAVLLGAEIEGVPTGFNVLHLDRRAEEWADVLRAALNVPVDLFDPERAALAQAAGGGSAAGDLSPAGWRTERLRGERGARLRRRLLLGLGVYLAVLGLLFVGAGVLWVRARVQRAHLERLRAPAEFSQNANAHWRTLAPAIDPSRYLTETMREVYECLPADSSVLWTAFDLTPRTLTITGEAPTVSAAVDFTEKLQARPGLRAYKFAAEPPASLPNGKARFHVTGTLPEK